MKPFDDLPTTTSYILFPPAGQVAAFAERKERIRATLRDQLPGHVFEIGDMAMGHEPRVIPICGALHDDGNGPMWAPPSREAKAELEARLLALDLGAGTLN